MQYGGAIIGHKKVPQISHASLCDGDCGGLSSSSAVLGEPGVAYRFHVQWSGRRQLLSHLAIRYSPIIIHLFLFYHALHAIETLRRLREGTLVVVPFINVDDGGRCRRCGLWAFAVHVGKSKATKRTSCRCEGSSARACGRGGRRSATSQLWVGGG